MDEVVTRRPSIHYSPLERRCQRIHKHYTFTKEDLDAIIATQAQALADTIDARAVEWALGQL